MSQLGERKRKPRFDTPVRLEKIRTILNLIAYQPMSVIEIAENLGQSQQNVNDYILHLMGEDGSPKRIHVAKRRRAKGGNEKKETRLFLAGDGVDAPPLPPLGKAIYDKRRLKRVKADPLRRTAYRMKARAFDAKRRNYYVKRDPLVAMFFRPLTKEEAQ